MLYRQDSGVVHLKLQEFEPDTGSDWEVTRADPELRIIQSQVYYTSYINEPSTSHSIMFWSLRERRRV